MNIRYSARTDVGMKRTHNEDYYNLIENENLFIVADGMGGHSSGEVASKMAAETVSDFYRRTRDQDATWPYRMRPDLDYIENRLFCGIKLANRKIFQAASQDPSRKGMGTTIVACLFNSDRVHIAHVGDSRCYRVRGGKIEQLTRDHSLLEDYRDAKPDITKEEELSFPHKNVITRALGMYSSVVVDITHKKLQTGDTYLLCSDGLSGMVSDGKLEEIVSQHNDLDKCTAALVGHANRAGGVDNITTLVVRCD